MSKGWSSLDLSEGKLILPFGDNTITGPAASLMYETGLMYFSNGTNWVEVLSTNIENANTMYVDPNGLDVNFLSKNILQPYATITGANTYATSSDWVTVNAGSYNNSQTIFLNNNNYYLNMGAQIVQASGQSVIHPSYGDNIVVHGNGTFYSNISQTMVNVSTIANIDLELDEIYDAYTGGSSYTIAQFGAGTTINGNIRIKKIWRDPSATNTDPLLIVNVSGDCALNVYIDELNVPLTQLAASVQAGSGAIVNIYCKRVFGQLAINPSSTNSIIRFFVSESSNSNISGNYGVHLGTSGGIVEWRGNINNSATASGSYGLIVDGTSGVIVLSGNPVINTGATVSIENLASGGVLQVVGQAYGNGTISAGLTGSGNGTYTQNTALVGL